MFEVHGDGEYLGEAVSKTQHSLQCAQLAEKERRKPEVRRDKKKTPENKQQQLVTVKPFNLGRLVGLCGTFNNRDDNLGVNVGTRRAG